MVKAARHTLQSRSLFPAFYSLLPAFRGTRTSMRTPFPGVLAK
jgi:hypothetical protein